MLFGPNILPEIESLIQNYKNNQSQESNNLKDLILTGCSIFIGDYLIDLFEESGGNIVFFDTWIGSSYFSQIFEDNILNSGKDPIELLTERFKNNIYGDHTVPYYLENKVDQLEKIVDDYKQKTGKQLAVINHIIKFCDHISIMSAFLKEALQAKEIPVLNLIRDYSKANRGQLSTRIEAFLEML
ncbi:MAG: 2-hydroxyacyl-CoA dehydratase [Promethearchaeota archaeon]